MSHGCISNPCSICHPQLFDKSGNLNENAFLIGNCPHHNSGKTCNICFGTAVHDVLEKYVAALTIKKPVDEPFRSGPFGIPRINYRWWADNMFPVERMPDGAMPFYESELKIEDDVKLDEEAIRMLRLEQKARDEWEAQETLIKTIVEQMNGMTLEARLKIIREFCRRCAGERGCQCWNDE